MWQVIIRHSAPEGDVGQRSFVKLVEISVETLLDVGVRVITIKGHTLYDPGSRMKDFSKKDRR